MATAKVPYTTTLPYSLKESDISPLDDDELYDSYHIYEDDESTHITLRMMDRKPNKRYKKQVDGLKMKGNSRCASCNKTGRPIRRGKQSGITQCDACEASHVKISPKCSSCNIQNTTVSLDTVYNRNWCTSCSDEFSKQKWCTICQKKDMAIRLIKPHEIICYKCHREEQQVKMRVDEESYRDEEYLYKHRIILNI